MIKEGRDFCYLKYWKLRENYDFEFLANSNCSDFMIKNYNGSQLRLIGSFDLCYYSEIEILFEEVSYISMYTYFGLWDLEKKPFKVKFEANDLDCLFEIQIGEEVTRSRMRD